MSDHTDRAMAIHLYVFHGQSTALIAKCLTRLGEDGSRFHNSVSKQEVDTWIDQWLAAK